MIADIKVLIKNSFRDINCVDIFINKIILCEFWFV